MDCNQKGGIIKYAKPEYSAVLHAVDVIQRTDKVWPLFIETIFRPLYVPALRMPRTRPTSSAEVKEGCGRRRVFLMLYAKPEINVAVAFLRVIDGQHKAAPHVDILTLQLPAITSSAHGADE